MIGQREHFNRFSAKGRKTERHLGRVDLGDECLELVDISTEELADLSALVVGLEGRHGTDSGGSRDLTEVINIDLDKLDIFVLLGEGLVLGGNDLAGTITKLNWKGKVG